MAIAPLETLLESLIQSFNAERLAAWELRSLILNANALPLRYING